MAGDLFLLRAEFVTAVNRMLGRGPLYGYKEADWPDVPDTYWAYHDILEASHDHEYEVKDQKETWVRNLNQN